MNRESLPFDTCMHWQKQLVHVEGYPIFEVERSFSWKAWGEDGWSYSGNYVFVCPRCLKQWAHLTYQRPMFQRELPDCLNPVGVFCGECGPGYENEPSGSILLSFGDSIDLPLLYALPEPLLKREFAIHLKYYDQRESNVERFGSTGGVQAASQGTGAVGGEGALGGANGDGQNLRIGNTG